MDPTLPEQRVAEVAGLLPGGGALTGWAALLLRGGAFFDGRATDGRTCLPVPVRLPADYNHGTHAGVRFVRGDPDAVVRVHGLPCVPVRQAVFDAMRLAGSRRDAVVVIDMAAAARLTSVERMWSYVRRRASWRGVPGVPIVRWALERADENSASPRETLYRLVWTQDAGLPAPLVNIPVFDPGGRLLGYPDLLDPVAGLVGEYDGDDHRGARRHSSDVDREARFRHHGLEVTRATSGDLTDPSALVHRIRSARARARFEDTRTRRWTTVPPAWWRPAVPVDVLLDGRRVDID